MTAATTPITSTSITDVQAQGIDTRIIATRNERHFCKCARCKQATTIDFEVVVWEFAFTASNGRVVWEPRVTYYRFDLEGKTEVRSTYIATCPRCGAARPSRKQLKNIAHSAHHVCNDKCQKATSDTCECSCGGLGHGIKNKIGLF